MKNTITLSNLVFLFLTLSLISCTKEKKTETPKPNIIPTSFAIDIPSAVSSSTIPSKSSNVDTLSGKDIYNNLRTFIYVGASAAQITKAIMAAIYTYNLDHATTLDYTSHDDNRIKHLEVIENPSAYNGVSYHYKLTITDSGNVNSKAIQVFWNNNPIKGVAILNPYNIDRVHNNIALLNTRYMIEYSEAGPTYQKEMTVSIAGYPLLGNWSMNNLKMFVGKNNNLLTMYGNTNHPHVILVDQSQQYDRNYAFIGHADDNLNIGIASVAIAPSSLMNNTGIITTWSIHNVLNTEIQAQFPGISQSSINSYLSNAQSPAYFIGNLGFVSCGSNTPNNPGFTTAFCTLTGLTPFIPNDVKNLTINFQ